MNSKFIAFLLFNFLLTPLFSQSKEEFDSLLIKSVANYDLKMALLKTNDALKIAKSINYEEGILRAELTKITIYCDHYDNTQSIKGIEKIESEIMKSKNNVLIAYLKQLKGLVYLRLHLRSEAKNELNSGLLYADKILNDDQRHYIKGKIYYRLGILNDDTDIINYRSLVLLYLKKAYKESSLVKDSRYRDGLIISCIAIGSAYTEKKDFTSAKLYLEKAVAISQKGECALCEIYAYNRIGNMYHNMNDNSNALKNYYRSIEICKLIGNYGMLQGNYQELLVIYEKLNNKEKVNETLRNLKAVRDTLDNNDRSALGTAVETIRTNVDIRHKKDKNYLKVYIAIGIILCFLLFYIVLMYLKKYRAEKENNEKLEKDLIEKTLFIQSLSSSKSIAEKDEELKIVIRMAIKNDVLFFQTFNELFPDFKEKLLLLDPFFKILDLKFCCYLKLNFDTKEIARYTGNSVRSVESKKYRLRKKIGISSQEDINAWFFNL